MVTAGTWFWVESRLSFLPLPLTTLGWTAGFLHKQEVGREMGGGPAGLCINSVINSDTSQGPGAYGKMSY